MSTGMAVTVAVINSGFLSKSSRELTVFLGTVSSKIKSFEIPLKN